MCKSYIMEHHKKYPWVGKIGLAVRIFDLLPEEVKVDLEEIISGAVETSVFRKNKMGVL